MFLDFLTKIPHCELKLFNKMLKRLNKNTKILLMKITWLDFIIVLTKKGRPRKSDLVIL